MISRLLILAAILGLSCLDLAAQERSVRGFVSIEPFEIRLEALVRPAAFAEQWAIDGDLISENEKQPILDTVMRQFRDQTLLRLGPDPVAFRETHVRFVQVNPNAGILEDARPAIPLEEALIGITLFANAEAVSGFELEWDWFAPEEDEVVIEIASQGAPAARILTREKREFVWEADEVFATPEAISIAAVGYDNSPSKGHIVIAALIFLTGLGVFILWKHGIAGRGRFILYAVLTSLLIGFFQSPSVSPLIPDSEAKEEIAYGLLRNTYHAFDYRDESAIYDVLAESVSGNLLEEIYLEIRSSLELETAGGPRVRVQEIDLREAGLVPVSIADGFAVRAEWVTIGEVTHWGHTHERTNKYEAILTISDVASQWHLTDLELIDEVRIQKVSRQQVEAES